MYWERHQRRLQPRRTSDERIGMGFVTYRKLCGTCLGFPEVDWAEFNKDHSSRNSMETMISRLESLITRMNNAKTLHNYDNYQSALMDYSYTTYKAGTSAPGFENKYKDLKQFFVKNSTSTLPPEEKK
ncbi:hypothetical protein [Chryseobacterium sp. RLHN22]|uniref:hypothetical protein n=1 Tax=Chryseobacterium sp. RLHN22 TaxID=3437885 RepID=UPI003D9BF18C